MKSFHVIAVTGKVETVISATKKERSNRKRDRNRKDLAKEEIGIGATRNRREPYVERVFNSSDF
jgi:hypothetical protein